MDYHYEPNYENCTMPYVQWYQDDFLGGVRGMRAHEIGIYTILLNEMYSRGKPLDLSIERLARLCGVDKRTFISALEMLIDERKIIKLECGLWNERCENAFIERAKLLNAKSEAGKTSSEKRNKINATIQHVLNTCPTDEQLISEAQTTDNKKQTPKGVLKKPPEKIQRGSRIPNDFVPDISAAVGLGLTEDQAIWQSKKFIDYFKALAGKDAIKIDWEATWRNWCRKAVEWGKPNQSKPKPFKSREEEAEDFLYAQLH